MSRLFKQGDLVRLTDEYAKFAVVFNTASTIRELAGGSLGTVVSVNRTGIDVLFWSEREIAYGFDHSAFELVTRAEADHD